MKIVSNTSPICYLYLINQIEVLPSLFGEVHIPDAVYDELRDENAPLNLRRWIKEYPAWINIHTASILSDPSLFRLHPGEREAICLAQDLSADLILLDEKSARSVASERSLRVAGLLGILDMAATRNMLNLKEAVQKLTRTNFRISPHLLSTLLNKHYGKY